MSDIVNYLEAQAKHRYTVEADPGRGVRRCWRMTSEASSGITMESNVIDLEEVGRILSCLTPLQREVAVMKADGASDLEIAVELGLTAAQLKNELISAQKNIRRLAPDLARRTA